MEVATHKRYKEHQNLNAHVDAADNEKISSNFQISVASAQGGRKYMEDRLRVEVGRGVGGKLDYIFSAVYDGHGGPQASEYVCQTLFHNITSNADFFSDDDQQVLAAIRDGFLRTHFDMLKESKSWPQTASGFPCTAGTTATCAFIRNGKLYTGHVGDSSIILANFDEDASGYNDAKLTEDHKPEKQGERQRIEKAGGAVAAKSGIVRVIWKRPLRDHKGPIRRSTFTESIPFLAVARSLGDFWSLNPNNNQFVVSPEPDVDVFRLKSSDKFIVIASDGLTNVIDTRAIVQILREVDEENGKLLPHSTDCENGGNAQMGLPLNYSHHLLQNAFKKWGSLRADNISIVCIKLNATQLSNDHLVGGINDKRNEKNISQKLIEDPFSTAHIGLDSTSFIRTQPLLIKYTGGTDKNFRAGIKRKRQSMEDEEEEGTATVVAACGNALQEASDSLPSSPKKKTRLDEHQAKKEEVRDVWRRRSIDEEACGNLNAPNIFVDSPSSSSSPKKKIALEEHQDEEDAMEAAAWNLPPEAVWNPPPQPAWKPPPAKRSRLQSVLNFFSNLLKW